MVSSQVPEGTFLAWAAHVDPTRRALLAGKEAGGVEVAADFQNRSAAEWRKDNVRLQGQVDAPSTPSSPEDNASGQAVVPRGAEARKPELSPSCEFFRDGFSAPRFLRGDSNEDGKVDISDSLFILGCKFLGTGCPGCRDAGDLNEDGAMDISDAVHGLNFLFSGGRSPDYPGPSTCGSDLTDDSLPECDYFGCGGSS